MKIAYKHLVNFIPSKPSIEEISQKLYQLGHENEIKNDIFDIEITPNRGDCISIDGILRDLSVFFKVDLNRSTYDKNLKNLNLNFTNNAKDECPFISFLKIEIDEEVINYAEPLNSYFDDLGMKRNNFFTDISNYIAYESGQPTHCYDAKKISDKFSLEINSNEQKFTTIFNNELTIDKKNLVFIQNSKIISLAGVIGGKETSCDKSTRTVLVECAYFKPEAIIGKTLKYNLNSDAAYKFERGVDPTNQEKILRRFLNIVNDHTKIINAEIYQNNYKKFDHTHISTNVLKINEILGTSIDQSQFKEYLLKLGFGVDEKSITVPPYRNDVKTQNDIAEEIARVIGYDQIPRRALPKINKTKNIQNLISSTHKLKSVLIRNNFYEVINNPFVSIKSSNSIQIDNPLDKNKAFLRTSLESSLIDNLLYNERRQHDSIKLFEISDIYEQGKIVDAKKMIGIISSGRVGKNYPSFSKKIDINYLSSLLNDFNVNANVKYISRENLDTKLKSKIVYTEFVIDSIENYVTSNTESGKTLKDIKFIKYKPISEYPCSYRDLSFSISSNEKYMELQSLIKNYKHELIKEIFIFDFYHDKKNKLVKIGYRFIFNSHDHTIKEFEVNDVMNNIIKKTTSIEDIKIPGLLNF